MPFARRVAEHAPFVLVYLDRELRVRFANRQCCEVFGRAPEELVGRRLGELVDEGTLRHATGHVAELERGNPAPREYLLRDARGTRRSLQVHAALDHDQEGRCIGYVACSQSLGVRLGELAAAAVCEVSALAAERGVRLETRADGTAARVSGDYWRLQRTVARLVTVAIERSAPGALVCIDVAASPERATLLVRDECRESVPGGHLGLSVARAFVERLGGALDVATGDAGASIRVELPRLAAGEESQP